MCGHDRSTLLVMQNRGLYQADMDKVLQPRLSNTRVVPSAGQACHFNQSKMAVDMTATQYSSACCAMQGGRHAEMQMMFVLPHESWCYCCMPAWTLMPSS